MDKETKALRKACIVDAGLDRLVAKAHYASFRGDLKPMEDLCAEHGYLNIVLATQVNYSRMRRSARVRQKIEYLVMTGNCIFLSLTFRDDVLSRTSRETRRRYVARFLKSECLCYAANIDFGDDGNIRDYIADDGSSKTSTGREHYHALVYCPDGVNLKAWKYGNIDAERVRTSKKDLEKVSKYVAKLSNHALKVNGGHAPRLIYSRGDCFAELMGF